MLHEPILLFNTAIINNKHDFVYRIILQKKNTSCVKFEGSRTVSWRKTAKTTVSSFQDDVGHSLRQYFDGKSNTTGIVEQQSSRQQWQQTIRHEIQYC